MNTPPWDSAIESLIDQLDAAALRAREQDFEGADALLEAHDAALRQLVAVGVPTADRARLAVALRRVLERERAVMAEFEHAREQAAQVLAGFHRTQKAAHEYTRESRGG